MWNALKTFFVVDEHNLDCFAQHIDLLKDYARVGNSFLKA